LGGNRTCRRVLLGEVLIVRHVLVEIVVARH
jgi:hypothetical protein